MTTCFWFPASTCFFLSSFCLSNLPSLLQGVLIQKLAKKKKKKIAESFQKKIGFALFGLFSVSKEFTCFLRQIESFSTRKHYFRSFCTYTKPEAKKRIFIAIFIFSYKRLQTIESEK